MPNPRPGRIWITKAAAREHRSLRFGARKLRGIRLSTSERLSLSSGLPAAALRCWRMFSTCSALCCRSGSWGRHTGIHWGTGSQPELLQINEEILGSIGRSWPDPRAISTGWFRSKTAYEFQERIVAEIATSYGDAPLIVIKEPRICRIAPLYLDALDVLNIEPLVVLPVRHPAEVIQSISERDGNDQRTDELIWLRDLIEAEHTSRTTLRVWTSFEHLLDDWQGTAQSISSKLGITWPNQPEIVAAEVGTILKPRHRHYQAPCDSISLPLGDWAVQTWRAAQYALSGNEPQAQDLFDRIRKAICEFDRLNVPQQEWMERRLTEMTQTIEAMN